MIAFLAGLVVGAFVGIVVMSALAVSSYQRPD